MPTAHIQAAAISHLKHWISTAWRLGWWLSTHSDSVSPPNKCTKCSLPFCSLGKGGVFVFYFLRALVTNDYMISTLKCHKCVFSLWRSEIWHDRVGRAALPCLFQLFVEAGVLGLWQHHTSLCLCLHMAFFLCFLSLSSLQENLTLILENTLN